MSLQSGYALIQCAAARLWENHTSDFDTRALLLFATACDNAHCSKWIFRPIKIPQKAIMRLPVSILSMVAAFCVLTAVFYLLDHYAKRKQPRSLFGRDPLPRPGQPWLAELDAINKDLRRYYLFVVFSPPTIFAVHLSQSYFGGAAESSARLAVSVGGGLFFCLFLITKIKKLLDERRTTSLGYEAALEVARELEQLADDDFHIYHNFPAETFRIDHIVVGQKGVFTVATKAYAKPAPGDRMQDATVEYDGRMLYFPRAEDFKTIDEAQRQAAWLSDWLGNAIGEPIAARAIVAMPGWLVKRISAEGIPVVNPKQFPSLFKHIKPRPLSKAMIRRINYQLDQK